MDLNPHPLDSHSSTLTTLLPLHPTLPCEILVILKQNCAQLTNYCSFPVALASSQRPQEGPRATRPTELKLKPFTSATVTGNARMSVPPRRCTVSVGGMDLELGPGNQHKVNWWKTRLSSALVTIKTLRFLEFYLKLVKKNCSLTLILPEKCPPNLVTINHPSKHFQM